MTPDKTIAFAILGAALVLFVWGRWRYNLVAIAALLAVVLTGLVPANEAFFGFAHPAVVTVAAVLVISRALRNAGIIDLAVQFSHRCAATRPVSLLPRHRWSPSSRVPAGV